MTRRCAPRRHGARPRAVKPVFVDDTGRRALVVRWLAAMVLVAVAVAAGLFLVAVVRTSGFVTR